ASLRTATPGGFDLDATGAHAFLTETAWLLEQAGFGVLLPAWWTPKGSRQRLAVRAKVKTPPMQGGSGLTLEELIKFDWRVPLGGVDATGWLGDLLGRLQGQAALTDLPPPAGLHGTLRPYQVRGYSWLAFLRQWGLGACLADDMGLGKTVQTLALIERDWEG